MTTTATIKISKTGRSYIVLPTGMWRWVAKSGASLPTGRVVVSGDTFRWKAELKASGLAYDAGSKAWAGAFAASEVRKARVIQAGKTEWIRIEGADASFLSLQLAEAIERGELRIGRAACRTQSNEVNDWATPADWKRYERQTGMAA